MEPIRQVSEKEREREKGEVELIRICANVVRRSVVTRTGRGGRREITK